MSSTNALEQMPATTDDKGRTLIPYMTTDEKLTEILSTMRALADAMQELGQNPMLMALMPKGIKF